MIGIEDISVAIWIVNNQSKYRQRLLEYGYTNAQIDEFIRYAQEWVDTGVQPTWEPEVPRNWWLIALLVGGAIVAVVVVLIVLKRRG